MNACRASDPAGAPGLEAGDERCGSDRRSARRRATGPSFDPLFAATLVNQIAPAETEYTRGYATGPAPVRRGFIVNARA